MKKICLFLILSTPLATLHSQESSSPTLEPIPVEEKRVRSDHYFTFQLDNDLFAGTDDGYTNGLRLSWNFSEKPWVIPEFFDDGLKRIAGGAYSNSFFRLLAGFEDPDAVVYNYGVSLTQLIFTPTTLETATPPPGERPYAAHLGIGFALHAKDRNTVNSIQLTLGITGENALGEEAQDFIHSLRDFEEFQGWDSQIEEEFTITLSLANRRRYEYDLGFFNGDNYIEYGSSLGNFRTDFYAGALTRFGYNVTNTFVDPRISINSYTLDGADNNFVPYFGKFSAYLIFGVRGYLVLHDITLDGPVFRDTDTNVTRQPWVGEAYAGFGLRYEDWELAFTQTFRSEEFKEDNGTDSFGSLAITKRF